MGRKKSENAHSGCSISWSSSTAVRLNKIYEFLCASYVMAAMLDDVNKAFPSLTTRKTLNMAKILLFFHSKGIGWTPHVCNPPPPQYRHEAIHFGNGLFFPIRVNIRLSFPRVLFSAWFFLNIIQSNLLKADTVHTIRCPPSEGVRK